jgi:hypothetical protein
MTLINGISRTGTAGLRQLLVFSCQTFQDRKFQVELTRTPPDVGMASESAIGRKTLLLCDVD